MKATLNVLNQSQFNPYADQAKVEREKRVSKIADEARSAKKVSTLGGPALLIGDAVINFSSLEAELYVDAIVLALGYQAKKNPRG